MVARPEEEEPMQMVAGPEEEEPMQMVAGPEEEELPAQGKFTAQLKGEDEELPAQGKFVIQKKENNTGLPDNLKTGVENLSGMSMDHVKVHYNSAQPAQLNALAYAQGSDIHVASGQEKHLPHEAWHVVQQMQGRVKPTMQMKENVPVNDDKGLETEADVMGAKALDAGQTLQKKKWADPAINFQMKSPGNDVMQRKFFITGVNSNKAITDALIDAEYGKGEDFIPALKLLANKKGTPLTFTSWEAAVEAAKNEAGTKPAESAGELPEFEKFGENVRLPKEEVDTIMRGLGLKPPEKFVATNSLASYAIIYLENEVDYHISWVFDPTGQVAIGVHYAVRDISPKARKKEVLYRFYKVDCASDKTLTATLTGSAGEGDKVLLGKLMAKHGINLDSKTQLDTALVRLKKQLDKPKKKKVA